MLRLATDGAIAASNRFVRFGYRRPPPWKSIRYAEPSSTIEEECRKPQFDYSSWSEVRNGKLDMKKIHSDLDSAMVPSIAHGIDVVLRGDGLYPLEAPWTMGRREQQRYAGGLSRSSTHRPVQYYKDSLRKIVQPEHIAWGNIPGYIPAANDSSLHRITAATPGATFSSSTSSITPAITAMYHLLSNYRDTELKGGLSSHLSELPSYFSKFHRRPIAITLSKNDSSSPTYSVNAHSGGDFSPTILRELGHSMERMLTTPPEEFSQRYVTERRGSRKGGLSRTKSENFPSSDEKQFYNYSQISKFVLRAQIDCQNAETGEFFDVKTRAVAPIRYDLNNYAAHTSHRIRYLQGRSDSYEREFYDMVRTVFLKYALQLRIGRMSGALVAYHNTSEILGLEYISLKEIQSYVFGGQQWADVAFGTAVQLLEEVLSRVTEAIGPVSEDEKVKVLLHTEWSRLNMYIFAQKLKSGEDDAFGYKEFVKRQGAHVEQRGNTVLAKDFSGNGQWHFDAGTGNALRGISLIGCHKCIARLGGKRVGTEESGPRRRNIGGDCVTFNHRAYDTSSLTPDTFRVWELRVAPLLNGELAPRNNIRLDGDDEFRLKYKLTEVHDIKKVHMSKFVSGLGRIYVR